jgi:alpha-L-rhamnosidase
LTPTPVALRFEHHAPGRIGTGEASPRLSWTIDSAPATYQQRAARLQIQTSRFGKRTSATVHELDGAEQILVPWPGQPLSSRDRATVRVQVRGVDGWGGWSDPATVEVGLLEVTDWVAQFVGPAREEEDTSVRAPGRVRKSFVVPGRVSYARLYLTGHGLVEAEINGRRVGDEELTPGWTSYRHRLRYAAFDVAEHLQSGENAIGVWLGDGWWRGRLGSRGGRTGIYGDSLAAFAQLEYLTDGELHTVVTDETWAAGPGPIVSSGLYDGERFDARLHDPAWSLPGSATGEWSAVAVRAADLSLLVEPQGPPVRCTQELNPVSIESKGDGRWLLDFGQNHSGRVRIRADGSAGNLITLRHAEVLVGGDVYTVPLRGAAATDQIVLAGEPIEWEPRFTIHGYRYVEVSGWAGPLHRDDVVSRVLHTDMERVGWFGCSNDSVNRLHDNVMWGLRSNFVDLPTDCPQRDERLGWTGDLQVFAPTAAFLYAVTGMLSSWLQDVAAEQNELDWVPLWVPYFEPPEPPLFREKDPSAVWGDVAVLTPDVLFERTGDIDLIRRQYASAKTFLAHVERSAGPDRICKDSTQFGDWLDPAAPPDNPYLATTDAYLVATAYFAHSARRLARTASVIGEESDAARFTALADEVASAYAARFLLPGGRAINDTQTAYALTTVFDLWPDSDSRLAGTRRLAALVRTANGRIATGFAGTPAVCDALTQSGHIKEAYQLLENTQFPGWLHTVSMGATTIWERWDSMLPDGSINPARMTSFNHYALGAVADWLHRVVAGIAPAAPGYRNILFAPRPGGTITSASATHHTPYGAASISWTIEKDNLRVVLDVPVGATAEVSLPSGTKTLVGHGRHQFVEAGAHQLVDADEEKPCLKIN